MSVRESVLMVDDDAAVRSIAERLLRDRYDVSLAASGEAALRLLRRGFRPDLILLDVSMPEMDGFETLVRVREIKGADWIPVIFLTGCTETQAEVKGFLAGAADYITKPYAGEVLRMRIQTHMENGRQRRLLHELQNQRNPRALDEQKFAALTDVLSNTERSVARLIALGHSNQEICEELNYSYYYIKKVATSVFEKLGVNQRGKLKKLFR